MYITKNMPYLCENDVHDVNRIMGLYLTFYVEFDLPW